jgi:hypothetical protein
MAQFRDNTGKFISKDKASDQQIEAGYEETLALLKKINVEKAKGQQIDEGQKKFLIEQLVKLKKEKKLRDEIETTLKRSAEASDDALESSTKIYKSYRDTQKVSSKVAEQLLTMTGLTGTIGVNLQKNTYQTKAGVKAAADAASAMESYSSTVSKAMREFDKGNISAESLASTLKQASDEMDDFVNSLDESNVEVAKLKQGLQSTVKSSTDLSKQFGANKKALADTKRGIADIASEAGGAIPGVSSLATTLTTLGSLGVIGGIVAMGLALSQLVGYVRDVMGIKGLSGMTKVGIEMQYEMATGINALNKDLTQTSMQLGQSVQISGALKANMVKLGVSAQEFQEATTNASNDLGLMGKEAQAVGADMAMYAKRTGASAEDLDKIANSFRIVGNLSGKAAVNSLGMAESVAKTAGVPVNALFKDLAESSELFLQNNYGNEKSLMKQAATLRVMGVAAQKVLQAGQSMVLNYKDSIKSEMELGALLGRQVDLSKVRQQFAGGDAAGAAQTLREQLKGIDLDKMNMFQRQALQQATGMDMDTIMKLGKGGPGGKLQTQQEQMAGSIKELGNSFDASIKKYIGDGITIKDLDAKAATAMWAAEAAKKQADIQAGAKRTMDESLNKLGDILIGIGLMALAFGAYKLLGKLLPKLGAKLLGTGAEKAAAGVAEEAVAKEATEMGVKSVEKAGVETVEAVGEKMAVNSAEKMAVSGGETALAEGTTMAAKGGFSLAKAGTGLLKSAGPQILATGLGMAGDYFGSQREAQGMAEGDRTKVNEGKAMKVGGEAAEYAGYGMMVGSVIPGVGTAIGGAVGGVIGGIKGIWDNWFSDDAKKKDEALKQQIIAKKMALKQQATADAMKEQQNGILMAAQDTGMFQAAVVAQLIEATRLLEIMAFATDDEEGSAEGKKIYLDGKLVSSQAYDRASILYNANSRAQPTVKGKQ